MLKRRLSHSIDLLAGLFARRLTRGPSLVPPQDRLLSGDALEQILDDDQAEGYAPTPVGSVGWHPLDDTNPRPFKIEILPVPADETGRPTRTSGSSHALAPAQAATWLVDAFESGLGEKPHGKDAGNPGGVNHMSNKQDRQRSEADAELEREIRKGRKFTLAEAIGRLAGPGSIKGESPVARMQ